jgi:hypothetical protein
MIKHGLNNEIIKLNVNFLSQNFNQMIVMSFWKVKIKHCFQKSLWNDFFFGAYSVHNWNI